MKLAPGLSINVSRLEIPGLSKPGFVITKPGIAIAKPGFAIGKPGDALKYPV